MIVALLGIGAGIIGLIIIYRAYCSYRKQRLKEYLRLKWGNSPSMSDDINNFENIGVYWRLKSKKLIAEGATNYIDDITWNDLSMDEVFEKINCTESSIGESYLYDRLHLLSFDEKELEAFEELVQYMDRNEEVRLTIQVALNKIGKALHNTMEYYLFDIEKKTSYYRALYNFLGVLPLISLLVLFINLKLGIYFLIGTTALNAYIHNKYANNLIYEMTDLKSIYTMLCSAKVISKLEGEGIRTYCNKLNEACKKLDYIMKFNVRFLLSTHSDLGILQDYAGIVTLSQIRVHHKLLILLKEQTEALRCIYDTLGLLESSIAVASYRSTLDYWVIPTFNLEQTLEVENIYHPLLDQPIPNSARFSHNVLITGSNASGKSTFVKALAINGILAQAIHTVLATRYNAPMSYYMTSMAISDSIDNGESYYIAEIRSLKRILDAIGQYPFCICFVDEILKGTNTVERIAASASILKYLSAEKCLCFVASHDIELTRLLKESYKNYHFCEQIDQSGISFDYKIYEGPSSTRNAIKLLEVMAYEETITNEANQLASYFMEHQAWPEADR